MANASGAFGLRPIAKMGSGSNSTGSSGYTKYEIANGNFREDLYHRLSVILIEVPPLRDRTQDIITLTDYFLKEVCASYGVPLKSIKLDALDALNHYMWPGNIRELRNVVERLVILCENEISGKDIIDHTNLTNRTKP